MLIGLKSQVGTVLYSAYHLGCHPGSRVTISVKRKRIVIGIRPGVVVGGTGEVKIWRKNLEGQRKSHWSWWASWNFSGSLYASWAHPTTRLVPHGGAWEEAQAVGWGHSWAPWRSWTLNLEESMVIHSSILAWRIPWTRSLSGYSA